MDPRIFRPEPMGLRDRPPTPIEQRLIYNAEQNILYCNFEGIVLETPEQAADLAEHLDGEFQRIGRRVDVIVNYDNFDVLPSARSKFFAMIKHNEKYVNSRTRYSTNAFFRRRLGKQFTEAKLNHRLYGSFADARAVLYTEDEPESGTNTRSAGRSRAPAIVSWRAPRDP